ncbi:hypothetical protein PAECIP111891_06331 [Paenibacillus allorhizoplanae]|uniref:Uncharacterized protein n=1 Tax=Paenibacillus allorhizoplanae TaxID=2905648 RepID=A0ABM9CXN1_9BACL|nr:hypothetical protein [Paenibacillus allorhizoplanae]CAH1228698.1 hypothetical protein PAECIP111891_06331 [Paenibacillus allorhizoplanae]
MIWSLIIVLVSLWTLKVQINHLRAKKQYKEIWFFILFLSISALFSMAVSLKIPLLNPLDVITYVFRPMGKMITTLLT